MPPLCRQCPCTLALSHTLPHTESIIRLYYQPEMDVVDAADRAKKVVLPEDVRLLDECAEAAQRCLKPEAYSAQQVCAFAACRMLAASITHRMQNAPHACRTHRMRNARQRRVGLCMGDRVA
jgi:hypothetical protein